MSNAAKAVPKEQQTAFQRWELSSFGEERRTQVEQHNQEQELAQIELANLRQQVQLEAHSLGYKEGYKEGFEQGFREGLNAGNAEAQLITQNIQELAMHFQNQLTHAHQLIGRDLVGLAVDLARALTKKQIELDDTLILSIVQEAISQLHEIQQPAQIFVHPEDAESLRKHMKNELDLGGWKIIGDSHMERGGCRLETGFNLVDASLNTRWERLSEAVLATSQQSSIQPHAFEQS
jgi:flagellar assembly protein FliH